MPNPRRIVIIGGGPAGTAAARAARQWDARAHVIVLEKEGAPAARTLEAAGAFRPLSRAAAAASNGSTPEGDHQLRTGHEVTALHIERREVEVRISRGDERYVEPYDALVVATGSRSRLPDIPGRGEANVIAVRRPDDLGSLAARREGKTALVVGAGIGGMSVASALLEQGVTARLIDEGSRALAGFDERLAERVVRALGPSRISLGLRVDGVRARERSLVVDTSRGEAGPFDAVLFATGASPETALTSAAGIERGTSGAIRVDETQRTSAPDVFAAGECAETYHVLLRRAVYDPHPVSAYRQGYVAGVNAAGGAMIFRGTVGTRSLRVLGISLARTGLSAEEARREGIPTFSSSFAAPEEARAFGVERIVLVLARESGRILGAEIAGVEAALSRIDVLAAAISAGLDVDALAGLDLALAPPLVTTEDPLRLAAEQALADLERSLGRGEVLETAWPRRETSFDRDL